MDLFEVERFMEADEVDFHFGLACFEPLAKFLGDGGWPISEGLAIGRRPNGEWGQIVVETASGFLCDVVEERVELIHAGFGGET